MTFDKSKVCVAGLHVVPAIIIKNAKENFPASYSYTGIITEEQMEEIKKECDIITMSVYMNGTSWYIIRYRNEVRT